jgi:hypothetical protein
MHPSSSENILSTLNETRRRLRLLPGFLGLSLCAILAANAVLPMWQTAIVCVLLVLAGWVVHLRDSERTTTVLLYDLDESLLSAYDSLTNAVDTAGSSNRIWHIQSQATVLDRKYHAGAAAVISSDDSRLSKSSPPRVKTNISPPTITFGRSKLYLLPDLVLFSDSRGFGAIDYQTLQCSIQHGTFILDNAAPADAQVTAYTWRYVNKNGGPDRRFSHNPQLPIIRVADVHFVAGNGFAGVLKFSNVPCAEALCEGLEKFAASLPRNNTASNETPAHQETLAPLSNKSANRVLLTAVLITIFTVAYVAVEVLKSPAASFSQATSVAPEDLLGAANSRNISTPAILSEPTASQPVILTSPAQLQAAAAAKETPLPTASPTYRVVNVRPRDFLNIHGGPGENYLSIARLRPTAAGIVLRSGRVVNGSTTWRKITIGNYTGWVNEAYLQAEATRR